mgnify:CR=1 FL=1
MARRLLLVPRYVICDDETCGACSERVFKTCNVFRLTLEPVKGLGRAAYWRLPECREAERPGEKAKED